MGIGIDKKSYKQLIERNKQWLYNNTYDSLERDHIIAIMNHSVIINFPERNPEFSYEPFEKKIAEMDTL